MLDQKGVQPQVPWKVSDVVKALVLAFVGFVAIILVAAPLIDNFEEGQRGPIIALVTLISEGSLLWVVWLVTIHKYGSSWQDLGMRPTTVARSIWMPLVALLGSLLFMGLYALIVRALDLEFLEPPGVPEDLLGEGFSRMLNTLVIAFWAPFAEEVFFRGFLLGALVWRVGPMRAALISSAIFAAAHVSIGTMIPIFVIGMLLSWLYLKTRSLWPPLTAHMAQNLIVIAVSTS